MPPLQVQIQENFFAQVSHRFPADKILNPSLSQKLEFTHINQLLALSPKAQLLDFGCGSGRLTIDFLRQGFDVLGVDISVESLNELEYLYSKHRKKNWGRLTLAQKIPKNRIFDAIIGSDILHHLNFTEFLPILRNRLKKGHSAVFSEPNAWYPLWYPIVLGNYTIEKGLFHCSIPKLTKAIQKAGFQKSEFAGHGLIPTRLLNPSPLLCRQNALTWGNTSITKYFAFRLIIKAVA